MANYDYKCTDDLCPRSGKIVELSLPMVHPAPTCEICGFLMKQVYPVAPAHFKGKGFYKTDNHK